LREGSFLKFDTLSDDSLYPRLKVALMMKACEKCSALYEVAGQTDRRLLSRYLYKRFPRRIVFSLCNDSLVDFLLRQPIGTETHGAHRLLLP
jgi:hypothetical protein